MIEESRKDQIKKILAKVGKVLGGGGGEGRLVVLRCSTMEHIQTAVHLFPKAFPKIKWVAVPVGSASLTETVVEAVRKAASGKTVPIIYDFPGELEDRQMTAEAAAELDEVAGHAGLAGLPVILAVYPASVRTLVSNARTMWDAKAAYHAWPSDLPVFEEPQAMPAPAEGGDMDQPHPPVPELTLEGFNTDRPAVEETRKVLEELDGEQAAAYLVKVSRSHLEGGDAENARMFLLRAVQIYSQTANMAGMATAYHLLGVGAQTRGDHETALEWFEQSLDNLSILDDRKGISEVTGAKGYVYYVLGQFDSALRAFDEALKIDEELGLMERVAAGYRKMAMALERSSRLDAAEELYNKSLESEQELGNESGMARVFHHLGRLKEERGEYEEARQYYEQSLELKEKDDDRTGMATSYHQLGNLCMRMADFPGAVEHYEKAIELEEEEGDRRGLARTFAQLGLAHRDQGMVEPALYSFVRSYQILQGLRSPVAAEVLLKVEELQDLVTADAFNKILREASVDTSTM